MSVKYSPSEADRSSRADISGRQWAGTFLGGPARVTLDTGVTQWHRFIPTLSLS